MKKKYILFNIVSFSFILICILACRDTCDKKMGDTFDDIKWNSLTFSLELDKYIASFNITVNEALSVDYLRTASQETSNNASIDSIAFPDINQMSLYIYKSAIPNKNEKVQMQFMMKMGDRRDYTNCIHPGSPDKYEISFSFTINNTNEILNIDNISWSESVDKGSI
jgi:hypothetical protein